MKYIFIVNNVYKGFRSDCLSHDRRIDIDRDELQYTVETSRSFGYVTIVIQKVNETLNLHISVT